MTINIALATSEAVILGCDSLSSTTDYLLSPWDFIERDAHGAPVLDENGLVTARFPLDGLQPVVTNAFGGVTKMFSISHGGVEAAAVTSGLATLAGSTIHSHAEDFLSRGDAAETVAGVAEAFLHHMRQLYERDMEAYSLPLGYQPELEFLVGGYDATSAFPSTFRIKVKDNTCTLIYGDGKSGLSWAGQADGVERLLFGIDSQLRSRIMLAVNDTIDRFYEESKAKTAQIVAKLIDTAGLDRLPDEIDTEFVARPAITLPDDEFRLDIDFANSPMQDAIDLVSYLVNLQSGRAKFVRGVATVGGRTHIGVITRNNRLKMLNEPDFIHRNVGYSNDY
ncbi:Uncharacterised protein [Burkholderia pseudomallei]|uniref:hypothetical protein n=1 Tax=Burkholderia TaxID=32008 RepID=UPI00016AF961|nr:MULTISPECIES: hypothetical protein [Burkholderia]AIO82963.1 hypothetical protein DP46_4986 [Burkholderia pseudomallei]AIP45769.1 hypothetical protein DR56_3536 [Burkholderia pseudomallei MSHR5858]ALB10772.1 hypothetical protein ACT79_07680 [Burkholderia pseudomallei]EEH30348.1 hypothetical protein BUH_4336 [Burkholderia pseudomallei Pakistan 9]KUY68473.1 hypothetical protein WI27_32800 [Burkholderia cepacia]